MSIKKILKRILGGTLIGCMALSMIACGEKQENKDELVSAMTKDEIIMGVDDAFPPMGYSENGEIVGFDIDLANAVFEKMDKKLKIQTIDWTMKETELNNNNIDVIWNGYTITDKRKGQVDFTMPYLKNRQVIVTMANSDIKSKSDLSGKKVGAQANSSAVEAMEKEQDLYSSFNGGEAITFDNNDMVLRDLEAGRLDAAVLDEVLADYYISKKGAEKYNILTEDFGKEEYGIGVRKGDKEFLDSITNALNELKEEGKAQEISEKWFGENKLIY